MPHNSTMEEFLKKTDCETVPSVLQNDIQIQLKSIIMMIQKIKTRIKDRYKYSIFTRQFPPQNYNYYDYMDVWYYTFYLQPYQHNFFGFKT
ncbi:hypothetical protein CR513_60009, partial [Mucuna pruriens]